MLLLEQHFFFADQFCGAVLELEAAGVRATPVSMDGYLIADGRKIGNVNGAIGGWDRSGFIGATYERFPFPSDRAGFKQKPGGARHRDWARDLIDGFGTPVAIPVRPNADAGTVTIGDIVFSREVYSELINYVERGGYPRWQNETPPHYVVAMTEKLK